MGCGCNETTKECILRYTGETIDCLGITKDELMETAIQTLAENICALNEASLTPNCCETVVKYSVEALGLGVLSRYPIESTLPNTSYTVPVGGAGLYKVFYTAQTLHLKTTNCFATYSVYVNGVEYNSITRRTTRTDGNEIVPFTIYVSNISLNDGDVILIKGSALDETKAYPQNATYELTKIN